MDIIFFSKLPSAERPWVHKMGVIFLCQDKLVPLGIQIYLCILIICEVSFVPVSQLHPAQRYIFYKFCIQRINQRPDCLQIPCFRCCIEEKAHCKVSVKFLLISICWSRVIGWDQGSFHT